MTDPDQTPILNRIDRALHAVQKRDPAEALAAYRQAALTSPTITGSATEPVPCPCLDGTSTCRYRRLDGGMLWDCQSCRREWIVPDTAHVEDPEAGYWGSLLVAAAIIGSGLLIAIGFGGGWLARGWWA